MNDYPAPPTDRELYPAHREDLPLAIQTKDGEDGTLVAGEAVKIIMESLRDCGQDELIDRLRG